MAPCAAPAAPPAPSPGSCRRFEGVAVTCSAHTSCGCTTYMFQKGMLKCSSLLGSGGRAQVGIAGVLSNCRCRLTQQEETICRDQGLRGYDLPAPLSSGALAADTSPISKTFSPAAGPSSTVLFIWKTRGSEAAPSSPARGAASHTVAACSSACNNWVMLCSYLAFRKERGNGSLQLI